MRRPPIAAIIFACSAGGAIAQGTAMTRVLTCEGPDARMELYLPTSAVTGLGAKNVRIKGTIVGRYTLDLTDAGKGKMDEQVRVSMSSDNTSIIVDQYTRKLPPTRVPVAGGTVDFDNRFGTQAKCGPFNQG